MIEQDFAFCAELFLDYSNMDSESQAWYQAAYFALRPCLFLFDTELEMDLCIMLEQLYFLDVLDSGTFVYRYDSKN